MAAPSAPGSPPQMSLGRETCLDLVGKLITPFDCSSHSSHALSVPPNIHDPMHIARCWDIEPFQDLASSKAHYAPAMCPPTHASI